MRRKQRIFRRTAAVVLSLAPAILHVGADFGRRGARIFAFRGDDAWAYAGTVGLSIVIGALFVQAIARKKSLLSHLLSVLFVIHFTLALGGQAYFYAEYNAYLNEDVSVFASNLMDSVISQFLADIVNYAKTNIPPLLLAILLVYLARKILRPGRVRLRERASESVSQANRAATRGARNLSDICSGG